MLGSFGTAMLVDTTLARPRKKKSIWQRDKNVTLAINIMMMLWLTD
jgi:hypothetical protein